MWFLPEILFIIAWERLLSTPLDEIASGVNYVPADCGGFALLGKLFNDPIITV